MMKQIKLGMLRHRYEDAERNEYKVVEITGLKFVTAYLKYVIQYAEMNKLSDDDFVSFTTQGVVNKPKKKIGGAKNGKTEANSEVPKPTDEATNI